MVNLSMFVEVNLSVLIFWKNSLDYYSMSPFIANNLSVFQKFSSVKDDLF